jgi:hypothetical protein
VADAVLDADPLGRMSSAFGLVCRGDRGADRQLVFPPGRPRGEDRTGGLRAQALAAASASASRVTAGVKVSSSTMPT